MSNKALKIVLWIVFTVLFFAIFCGVSYLMSGSPDVLTAIIFFVVMAIVDKKGIGYLVDYYSTKKEDRAEKFAK